MSQLASSTVVTTLSDYARGIFPNYVAAQDPIITRLAPITRVAAATGKYKEFSDKNAFQAVQTARAIGGPAKRIEFLATDKDFNCTPQALEIGIDDQERAAEGAMGPGVEEAKLRTVVSSAAVSHVSDVVTAARTLAAAATPAWSAPAVGNPVTDIDALIQAIADDIGMFPTDIVFGLTAWRYFRNHDKVVARFPNAATVGVTTAQAQGILLNPNINIGITTAIKDANKPGATKATANMLASDIFIFFTSPNPDVYDASFMKTFTVGDGSIQSVRRYRDERARSDILALDWSRDIRVCSTISARRLTVT